jgi:hypothetical protein
MKKTGKVTRVKLQLDQVNSFILLGLVSSEPDYKLSLALNKKLNISLKNIEPVKLTGNNDAELHFSRFADSGESPDRIINLVSNRSGKSFLIRKLRNIDYIFHFNDPDNEISIEQLTSDLRNISAISAVFNIDSDSIRDKNLHFVIQ